MWRRSCGWNGPSRSNCCSENSIRKSSKTVPTQVRNERSPAGVPAPEIFGWLELGLKFQKPCSSHGKLHNPQMLARVSGQSWTPGFCFLYLTLPTSQGVIHSIVSIVSIVYKYQFQSPNSSHPTPSFPPCSPYICSYICTSISALQMRSSIPFFWDSQVVLVVKNLAANAGDIRDSGLIPGSGRSPRGEHGNPLQCSCLENPMDRGSWWAIVHRVAKSWSQLKQFSTHAHIHIVFLSR